MADVPFFRGPNRLDWLFAVMLQTACDWEPDTEVAAVAAILGNSTITRYSDPAGIYPSATVVVTDAYVFVVSNSTRGYVQWVGNVLGSPSGPVPPSHGSVSVWFGLCALSQYQGVKAQVRAAVATRKLVLVGFSLGGASVTILKDMFSRNDGIESACIAFGVPRAGTVSFAAGYPVANYSGFGTLFDPVLSVPPIVWTGTGNNNFWVPSAPFVFYTQIDPGFTLQNDGSITSGYTTYPVATTAAYFANGTVAAWHYQPLYAERLRSKELPDTIPNGFGGYPFASQFDPVASDVFSFSGVPWAFPPEQPLEQGVSNMACQLSFYIRDKASPPLGFQEIYYFPGDDPNVPFSGASPPSTGWVDLRRLFLSSSCEIYACRASHVGSPKKSYLRKYLTPIQGNLTPTDTIEDAICYLGFSPGGQVKRQFHFRGVPASWITADKLTPTGIAGQTYIVNSPGSFLDTLINNGLSMLAGSPGTRTSFTISSSSQAAPNTPITITASGGPALNSGTLIEIRGCKAAPLLNGRWLTIGLPLAGVYTLSGSQRYSSPPTISGMLFVVTPTLFTVATVQFNSVTSKKTGRPSFLQRGRQSAKLRHR